MRIQIQPPISVGLLLSYSCNARCRHCMYACSPKWPKEWISENRLENILKTLKSYLMPAPYGPDSVGLSHGLHFTGGEPFLNFPLLVKAVEIARSLDIPSLFVETNCIWAVHNEVTREKLLKLKERGLNGIMISVNPFYLEYVPFERTRRCVQLSREIFGQNTMVYQQEFYQQFMRLGIKGRLSFEDYLGLPGSQQAIRYAEFFMMGRAPYQAHLFPGEMVSRFPAGYFFYQPCEPPFLREWHNHVDHYGNYMPGFCGGLSLGNIDNLKEWVEEGLDLREYPILDFIIKNDFKSLFEFARLEEYPAGKQSYYSKCHLCVDMRKFLASKSDYKELQPRLFYKYLDERT